ncbi:hypothetical protein QBC37DRAFT_418741 [Rhypophila decipiens]|uniref:Uncharacterized protein n=1 Tax=Rhypophila decipiens TaxID=261697 RepID=A0AAN6YCT3_9PEZI|nr:hypothetical protein QBC37DRAFT_418741 [Rhypophila decipiens]
MVWLFHLLHFYYTLLLLLLLLLFSSKHNTNLLIPPFISTCLTSTFILIISFSSSLHCTVLQRSGISWEIMEAGRRKDGAKTTWKNRFSKFLQTTGKWAVVWLIHFGTARWFTFHKQ